MASAAPRGVFALRALWSLANVALHAALPARAGLLRKSARPAGSWNLSGHSLQNGTEERPNPAPGQCGFGTLLVSHCCEMLYHPERECGCWEKVLTFRAPFNVEVAVYGHDRQCLLAISGQIDGGKQVDNDWLKYLIMHDPLVTQYTCGKHTVRGFATVTRNLMHLDDWRPVAEHLASSKCSGGVAVTGTSWGGTMAEILTGCANRGTLDELQGDKLPTFRVERLVTFGVPPTATTPITDEGPDAEGGCIPGQRVFLASNTSECGATDLVAYSTRAFGFQHARMTAVQIIELPDGDFDVKVHPCQDARTPVMPDWDMVTPFVERQWGQHGVGGFFPEMMNSTEKFHRMTQYVWSLYYVRKASSAKLEEEFIDRMTRQAPVEDGPWKKRRHPTKAKAIGMR